MEEPSCAEQHPAVGNERKTREDRTADTEGQQSEQPTVFNDAHHKVAMAYYKERGICFPPDLSRSKLERIKALHIRDDDIVIVTYPKTGTWWTHQVVKQILASEGIEDEKFLQDKVNLLEVTRPGEGFVTEQVESAPSPRLLTTHMPVEFLPSGLLESKAKVVVVTRNPKDTAVSFFHFCQKMPRLKTSESWDSFIDEFRAGEVPWGPFYDHVLGYWKLKDNPNIFFLKYEDMKKDLPGEVKKLSTFLGRPLSEETLQTVASATQFDSMKKTIGEKYTAWARKGIVGDWKNYFSPEQSRAFDEQYHERLSGTGLEFEFE